MTFVLLRRVLSMVLVGGGVYGFARQCRKPAGWLGRRLARAMNISHARLTAWGLDHVRIEPSTRALDIGCGGGRTISTLATLASTGHIDGVDCSRDSVAVARAINADLIASGRVSVQQSSVSHLPFADESYDLVTAVETHYYWPDLANDLREVLRVLRPGGSFVLIAEAYRGRPADWLYRPVMTGLLRSTYLTVDGHGAALRNAGFDRVVVDTDPSRGWICATGQRPDRLAVPDQPPAPIHR